MTRRLVAARDHLLGVAACGLAVLLYANSLANGFVLDDTRLVTHNPLIRDLGQLPELLRSDYWAPRAPSGLYRPLVTMSYTMNFAVSPEPWSFHLANVLLHVANTGLVWLLARRVLGEPSLTGVAALLFAAHAVHTEAVAGVASGRPDLLAAFFFLLALCAHARREEEGARRTSGLYLTSLTAYALALLSKENAVTLLGVLVLYDWLYAPTRTAWPGTRWRVLRSRLGDTYLGYVVVTALYLGLRAWALPQRFLPPPYEVDNPLVQLEFPERVLSALYVSLRCAWLFLCPHQLSYDYSYNQIPLIVSSRDPRTAGVLVLCGLGIGLLAWSYRRSRPLFFGLGFAGITFSVVSNVFVLIGTILGERLLYLPSVGFCLAAPIALDAACRMLPARRRTQTAFFVALALVGIGLHGARTVSRNADWKDEETLFSHDVEVSPRSLKAQLNAGVMASRQGRYEEAIERYRKAIEIKPHDNARAYNNLGYLLIDREIDVERGVQLLERALATSPRGPDPNLLDSLAWGYYKLGRYEEALRLAERSLALDSFSRTTSERRAHLRAIREALERERAGEAPGF